MALLKASLFIKRLLHGSKTVKHTLSGPPNASSTVTNIQSFRHVSSPEFPLDSGFPRRFLPLPMGDINIREKLKGVKSGGEEHNYGGISPPATTTGNEVYGMTAKEAKKIMSLYQLEKLKAKVREIPKTCIAYSEFLRVCEEGCDNNEHQAVQFTKKLDDSGNVLVLGDVVFLQPGQVAKEMERVIWGTVAHPNDRRRKELEEMEKKRQKIEEEARDMVWRELYVGLGLIMAQTIVLMRLTFWELSWDVMEPICFFLTSLHVVLAFLFFIRTSTEPTFQGYFRSRFMANQLKLMRFHNFDVHKYDQLCKACYPPRP